MLIKHNRKPTIPSGASNTNSCKVNESNPITNSNIHKIIFVCFFMDNHTPELKFIVLNLYYFIESLNSLRFAFVASERQLNSMF